MDHEARILSMSHGFSIKTWCYTGMYHFSTEYYIHMLGPTEPWLKFLLMSLERAVVLLGLLGKPKSIHINSIPMTEISVLHLPSAINAQLSWFDSGEFFLRWVYGKYQLLRCAALPLFSSQHLWFNWFNFFGFHSFSYWRACAPSVLVYHSINSHNRSPFKMAPPET